MELEKIKKLTTTDDYAFLRNNPHLGDNICLLTLGGSHAYGMSTEGSDVDIRGAALRTKKDILTGKDFEQVINTDTDTTVYSFDKMVKLLCEQNPNMLEILFVKPEHILQSSFAGDLLLENRGPFLTKRLFYACGGYAKEQLRRLDTKTAKNLSTREQKVHILNSVTNATEDFFSRRFTGDADSESNVRLYVDDFTAENGTVDSDIFMDVNLKHFPLHAYIDMLNTQHAVIRDYNKAGKRAKSAYKRGAINKHAAHLIRLLLLAEKALRTGEFCTFMEEDHDLLMAIRNGEFMTNDPDLFTLNKNGDILSECGQMKPEFFTLVDELEKKMQKAFAITCLPEQVDMDAVNRIIYMVNDSVCCGKENV